VSVIIQGVNDGPVAAPDEAGISEDAGPDTVQGSLLDNDIDVDQSDALTVTALQGATDNNSSPTLTAVGQYGTLVINKTDGAYTYTLDNTKLGVQALSEGEVVADVFTYTSSDTHGASSTSTLTINITGKNDPPVARDDQLGGGGNGGAIAVYPSTDASQAFNVVNDLQSLGVFESVVLLNGQESLTTLSSYDAILVYQNSTASFPEFGNTLAAYVDGGGGLVATTFLWQFPEASNHGALSNGYLPFENYFGNYSFSTLGTYDANSPIMQGVTSLTGHYRDLVSLSSDATLVASWADGFPLVAIDSSGVVGIALFPNDAFGNLSGDYLTLFGNALSFVAGGDAVIENQSFTFQASRLLTNDTDVDGDTLSVTMVQGAAVGIVTATAHGTVVLNANGTITYNPNVNYSGADSFTYTISDGNGGTATATVRLTIASVNDAPVLDLDTSRDGSGFSAEVEANGDQIPIALAPDISDADDTTIESATITLTDGADGDAFFASVESLNALGSQLPARREARAHR
jgi:VCBS repeat-containing protein